MPSTRSGATTRATAASSSDEVTVTAKQRRSRRGALNKKKNMRKIDLSDVHAAMEAQRRRQLVGSAHLEDNELFVIDTRAADSEGEKGRMASSTQLSRRARATGRSLRSLKALNDKPHIKPISSRKRKATGPTTSSEKRSRKTKSAQAKNTEEDADEDEDEEGIEQGKSSNMEEDDSHLEAGGSLWNASGQSSTRVSMRVRERDARKALAEQELSEDWLEPLIVKPLKAAARIRRPEPSAIPAVEVPMPGASYNPSFLDHQALLAVEYIKEGNIVKARRREKNEAPVKLNATKQAQRWMEEVGQGVEEFVGLKPAPKSDSDDDDEDDNAVAISAPVRAENRKPRSVRRRQLDQRRREGERKREKEERLRLMGLDQIRALKKQINAEAAAEKARQAEKAEKEKGRLLQPRRLGKHKFKAPATEIKLSDELSGSVRKLKLEGNLITDRFASLQKRNIIETRRPTTLRRRYQLKVHQQRSYKNYDRQEEVRQEARRAKKAALAKKPATLGM